jgi:Flp pilus assembly protein TadG
MVDVTMVSEKGNCAWVLGLPAQLRRWQREERGAIATEFAIIAIPFAMMLFDLASVTLYYFAD